MVSKKLIAPTLAGTGAAGASGTLAWTLSLFGGESLGDVEGLKKQPEPSPEKVYKPAAESVDSEKLSKLSTPPHGYSTGSGVGWVRQVITKLEIDGTTPISSYFSSTLAYAEDKKVIEENMKWKVEWNDGLQSIYVKAGVDEKDEKKDSLWKCRLIQTSVKKFYSEKSDNSEFIRQGGDLIAAIKEDSKHKEKFVENCSKSIIDKKKSSHAKMDGEIELETEKDSNGKFRFKESGGYFQKLWTEDFTGVDKLSEEDEKLVNVTDGWNIEETKEVKGRTKKVKISLKNKSWVCSISGNYSGTNLGSRKFKKDDLKEAIESYDQSFLNEVEWKKYLLRNCAKHKKDIKGLTVRTVGSGEWDFGDLKKITERMYTNPRTAT